MGSQNKKVGVKKRAKLAMINMGSDDDEPIGSFLKLKNKKSGKKVKLDVDSEKGKKVEVMGVKDLVVDEDLGGMEDTLAIFRKKLKGPKKDVGSRSLSKKESGVNLVEMLDSCVDIPQNGGEFSGEFSRSAEDKVGVVVSDVNVSQKKEKKRERKSKSSKFVYAKDLGVLVDHDGVGIAEVDLCGNQIERQVGQTKKKKNKRPNFVLARDSLLASIDLDDGEFPKEHVLGDQVEGQKGPSCLSEENLADSLSSFLKKAQKIHSGSHKKSRVSTFSKSTGVQVLENDCGPSLNRVSSDIHTFCGGNTISDKELGNENMNSVDRLVDNGDICSSDHIRLGEGQDSDPPNLNEPQYAPFSNPMNSSDSLPTGEKSDDVICGEKPVEIVNLVQKHSCSLVVCTEKKGELKTNESYEEAAVNQEESSMNSLDKLCVNDASKSPRAEIKNQCVFRSQNDETQTRFTLCEPLNSSIIEDTVACSSPGSELMGELSTSDKVENNTIYDGKCSEEGTDALRADLLLSHKGRGDSPSKEIVVNEGDTEFSSPLVLPNERSTCEEEVGSFPKANNNVSNSLVPNERGVRKGKKRKDADMAYEGDTAWEVVELEHCGADRDQTLSVAAVSVGLKAHEVSPVEKIRFKEVLKRKGGLQEYLECRNKILSLWNKDVTRILPSNDCGITTIPGDNEPSRASLMRDIYSFLDQSGFINSGIATSKEKAEPHTRGNYKLLGEKKFDGSSENSVADSADGVSFILGQVKSADTISKTKNDYALGDENPSTIFDEPHDKIHDECKSFEILNKQQADVKMSKKLVEPDSSPAEVVSASLDNEALCSHFGSDFTHHNSKNQKKIIVVGAGPAGLTASRHLQRQGFNVTVLEARSRIGGRVHTDRSSLSVPVDLGASIITGVEADVTSERRPDPSSLVCAQLGLELTVLNSDCPLYDIVTGKKVPTDVDEALEAEFNSLLDDMVLVIAQKGESAARMSLEDGLEYGLKMRYKDNNRGSRMFRPVVTSNHGNGDDGYSAQRDVKDIAVSPLERRVMDWHFAHLEYGCAALLKDVSLPHWNQDDVYGGFGGAHCMIKGGYGAVVESIAQGLPIHLNQVVSDISYSGIDSSRVDNCSCKVKVSTSNGNEFFGDAVLITVPLGCLKDESIKFSPPLPAWKHSAIQRLGFGVLNKVVLEFGEVFWDDNVDYFGATAQQTDLRGRCFMFWNVKKTVGAPVLIALLVGKAALDGQDLSPSDQVTHAVGVLRKLFGDADVPDPVASVVTDWGRDPFSRGAYSYVAVGSCGEDYDIMGRPVENCLFFAGEATCKEHPDTVGGAMMSGLREAVRIIDILNVGKDYTAEAEAIEVAQRRSSCERSEVKDIVRRLDEVDVLDLVYRKLARESLLKDMFFSAKTSAGRLRLAKELLALPTESIKSFAGTKEGLSVLNSWILDSMGKDATQLLRHCVRILVIVSTDLVAVRLSGIGKTVKEKVCVHTSRDIRSIASQLVNVWIEVFRKQKATNGGLKLLRHMAISDSSKARGKIIQGSRKPPICIQQSTSGNKSNLSSKKLSEKQVKVENGTASKTDSKGDEDENLLLSEEERAALAVAEVAHAAALAAAEAYASSEARFSKMQLPKIPSFQKFARQEQYEQTDEPEKKRWWSGGVLGRQDCTSEIDSRNCRVRDWSVDFPAACANLDPSKLSSDNLSVHSHSNDTPQLKWREHSGESVAGDSSTFTKAWVDSGGSLGIKDYHAIERWQCQAAAAEYEYRSSMHVGDEEDSNTMSKLVIQKNEGVVESSVSQFTVNKEMTVNQRRGAEHIKQGVVDYVASLLMPLYKSRKIDKDGYKSIMKKSATKVMEQTTDAEKAMAVSEFLDFKRRNKIRAFVDKLIERHMSTKSAVKH